MDDFKLTTEERELINARRRQAAEREAAGTHQGRNVLEMSQAEYNELIPEERAAMMTESIKAAYRKD